MIGNPATDPELLMLLERARNHVMTKEEKAAQRKSFVIGQFMCDHPELSREYAESIYEKVIGI